MPNTRLFKTQPDEAQSEEAQAPLLRDAQHDPGAALFDPARAVAPTQTQDPDSIVGGAPTSEFPDCCAVGNTREGFFCSGTLIAPNLVVTAGHCESVEQVFLRGSDISKLDEGELIPVLPGKDFSLGGADLRVLVLERDSAVTPRHVAQGAEVQGETAVLVGFGNVDFAGSVGYGLKRMVEVPIVSLSCTKAMDGVRYGCSKDIEMVAGQRGLNRDSCTGDSGGPLYIAAPGGYFLLGATSRGIGGTGRECGDGGVYVRVDQFLDEIRRLTGIRVPGPLL